MGRDSYVSLIHSNASLSRVQKFHFLKAFLEGDAARFVTNISISDSNYDGVWKILKDEYDCPRMLIETHIHAFASFPIMNSESAIELKRLRDTVNASLSALRNLNRATG